MISRAPTKQFTVERRRIMDKPGGSHEAAKALGGRLNPPRPLVTFHETSGCIEVRLGEVCVGTIAVNPAGSGATAYIWMCSLPQAASTRRPARDTSQAKREIREVIAGWFEATGDLIRGRVLREARS